MSNRLLLSVSSLVLASMVSVACGKKSGSSASPEPNAAVQPSLPDPVMESQPAPDVSVPVEEQPAPSAENAAPAPEAAPVEPARGEGMAGTVSQPAQPSEIANPQPEQPISRDPGVMVPDHPVPTDPMPDFRFDPVLRMPTSQMNKEIVVRGVCRGHQSIGEASEKAGCEAKAGTREMSFPFEVTVRVIPGSEKAKEGARAELSNLRWAFELQPESKTMWSFGSLRADEGEKSTAPRLALPESAFNFEKGSSAIAEDHVEGSESADSIHRWARIDLSEQRLDLNFKYDWSRAADDQGKICRRPSTEAWECTGSFEFPAEEMKGGKQAEVKGQEIKHDELKHEEIKADESKGNEIKSEEVKTEEVKAEPVKSEEAKTEEVKAEEVKTEEAKTEEVKAEEVKTEEAKTEEVKTEEVKAEEAKTAEEIKAEEVKTEEAKTEEVKAEEVKTEEVHEQKAASAKIK